MKAIKIPLLILTIFYTKAQAQNLPEMVTIKTGEFKMGDQGGDGNKDEKPVHEVSLKEFKIAKTEITVAQYRLFCTEIGIKMPEAPSWGWIDNHPIVNVSWHNAQGYCKWLNTKTGKKYRLPTEAEWEYAARGGNEATYYKHSGSDNLDIVGWYGKNSGKKTHPAGQKGQNELGLYDMNGNAAEWCQDLYGPYKEDGKILVYEHWIKVADDDPKGAQYGTNRVSRGGSWDSSQSESRLAARKEMAPSTKLNTLGFRVVEPL